jgi:hypothetical protein
MDSKFVKDYVKVTRTIMSVETKEQMKCAKKMANLLFKKWEKHSKVIYGYDESVENLFRLIDSKTNLIYIV